MTAPRDPTVLFDLGNVLVRLDLERGLERLRRLAPASAPASLEIAAAFFSPASLACNRGELSPEQFLDALASQLGLGPDAHAALAAAWCDIFTRWPEMEWLAAATLAAGHRTFVLSNTDPLHYAWLSARLPILRQASGVFLSYEAGLIKPDPEFFRVALRRLGLEAARCVFLDDKPDNVEAARSVGIPAEVMGEGHKDAVRFLGEHGVRW